MSEKSDKKSVLNPKNHEQDAHASQDYGAVSTEINGGREDKKRKSPRFRLPPLPKLQLTKLLGLARYNKPYIFAVGVVIVVVVNFLLQPIALRVDLSRNQANTLSDGSRSVVRKLQKPVTITFFVSNDIPTQLITLRQQVQDLLSEYQRVSNGRITVEVRDPKTDDDAKQKASQNGINEFRFSQVQQDNFNVSTGYFALLVSYDQQNRPILNLNDTENLEYNITSAIYAVSRTETPKVAILGGEPQFSFGQQNDPLSLVRQLLSQEFTLEALQLSEPSTAETFEGVPTPTPVPKSIDTSIKTIILFPSSNPGGYSEQDRAQLDEYLKNKGRIIAFIEGVGVNQQILATREAALDLVAFAKNYGISVQDNLVLSDAAEVVNFGGELQQFFVPYPFWLRTAQVNAETGLFSNAAYLTFPWTSSVKTEDRNGYKSRVLVRTEPRSWTQSGGQFILDPQEVLQKRPTSVGQFDLIAEARKEGGGALMVIPSTRFVNPQFLSRESGNINFFLNVVSNYASGGVLSGIRSRAINAYPLPNLPAFQRDMVKYGAMLVLPVLFGAAGALYLMRRK